MNNLIKNTQIIRFMLCLYLLVFANYCSSNKNLLEKEKQLGTTGKYNWSFHRLSDIDKGVTLAFPGYIISLEKSKRKYIGAPNKKALKEDNALKSFGFRPDVYNWNTLQFQKRMVLNDPKSTFVSSIFEYELNNDIIPHIEQKTHYNAYESFYLDNAKNAFDKGYEALENLGDTILNDIKENNITHVFFLSMGWNSDQQEAIRNFNSLFLKLMNQAVTNEKEFRPIFVGFTWASKWNDGFTNVFSLFNKNNDADEIGMLWFNLLLNKKVLDINNNLNFKTVLIGHSLGALVTSRATMSASMLEKESKRVDLLINLESAYSINRYSEKKGIENTFDYENWNDYVRHIALIWSEYDTATSVAIWAPYAGGKRGYKRVVKNPEHYKDIELKVYDTNRGITFNNKPQLLMIDGSSIIYKDAHFKGGGSHSDIYNKEVAKMLWELIESSTY